MEPAAATHNPPSLKPLEDCRLYTFIDTAYLAGRDHRDVAWQLCTGGSDIIQLRAKREPISVVRRMAEDLVPITRSMGAWLIINDYPDVALEVGAPGCHLGQEDFFEAGHRHVDGIMAGVKRRISVGLSSHAPSQAARALEAGAHYVAIGPVFATPTKPSATPVTLDYVRWASENIRIPWFAIGGITLANVESVLHAGARRVCVVSAILNSADVSAACRNFRAVLGD